MTHEMTDYDCAKHVLMNAAQTIGLERSAANGIVDFNEHLSFEGYAEPGRDDIEIVRQACERIIAAT